MHDRTHHAPDAALTVADFIARWRASGAAERANYAPFLSELCDVLGVPRPDPTRPDDRDNAYVFERFVRLENGDGTHSTGRIDLYKRGCFLLEAKQGSAAEGNGPELFADRVARTKKGTVRRVVSRATSASLCRSSRKREGWSWPHRP